MTGYTSLDAYEQFCEDYLDNTDYSNVLLDTATSPMVGKMLALSKLKGEIVGNLLEHGDLAKGGLIGAGAVGAGILGTKAVKKLIKKRKNKKPFKDTPVTMKENPTFSECDDYNEFSSFNRQLRKLEKSYNKMQDREDAYKQALKSINKELKGSRKIYRNIVMSDILDKINNIKTIKE